jgi:hypothetical protein
MPSNAEMASASVLTGVPGGAKVATTFANVCAAAMTLAAVGWVVGEDTETTAGTTAVVVAVGNVAHPAAVRHKRARGTMRCFMC